MLVNFIYFFITLSNCKAHLIMFGMKNALYKFLLLFYYLNSSMRLKNTFAQKKNNFDMFWKK